MNDSGLKRLLEDYRGQRGWILPLSDERGRTFANNGDLLMHRVWDDLCRDLDITLTDDPDGVDFIAVPPNGALLDRFRAPEIVRSRLRPHRDRPLVIFPSSAQFLQEDPSAMFEHRSAPTLWILREPYSYAHLEQSWGRQLAAAGVVLALDHDVVISGSRHVPKYFTPTNAGPRRDHPSALLVSRLGVEARDIRNDTGPLNNHEQRAGSAIKRAAVEIARALPPAALRPARRMSTRRRIQNANRDLLLAVPRETQERFDDGAYQAATDISDTSLVSFEEYCARIAAADLVLTNRLHVAIPAALMGTETILVDSGYHKLRGIYEHSLEDLESITLVNRS